MLCQLAPFVNWRFVSGGQVRRYGGEYRIDHRDFSGVDLDGFFEWCLSEHASRNEPVATCRLRRRLALQGFSTVPTGIEARAASFSVAPANVGFGGLVVDCVVDCVVRHLPVININNEVVGMLCRKELRTDWKGDSLI
jgi:hypothetical protein